MVCESQLYELDNEHIEGVKVEIPLTCRNYYDVLTENNDVSQIIESNITKGQFLSNKLQQKNISEPKDNRKRKTVGWNVTTKKKAKFSSTNESSNNSKIKNEMPIHSQPFAKQNMTKFHNSIKYTIYHCDICQEAWPLKTKPKNYPNYICSRISRDKSL